MSTNFMVADVVSTAEAVLVFSFVLLVPGYVIARLLGLFGFGERTFLARCAIAVPLSIGICPILTYYLLRFSGVGVWLFYGACNAAFFLLLFRDRRTLISGIARPWRLSLRLVYLAFVLGWGVLATGLLIDLQIGQRLYFPTVAYDYAARSAFTSAISRTGIPPHNPYFFPSQSFNLRYHYFWPMMCSVTQRILSGQVTSRQAMLAGTIWCGIGLLATVPLYLRFFSAKAAVQLERRMLLAAVLLIVTGLDLLPVLMVESLRWSPLACLEWWNNDPVMGWPHAVLWVPHHVTGLIACLMAFLILWSARRAPWNSALIAPALVASVLFASALGMSIYVTLTFATCLMVFVVVSVLRRDRRMAGLICVSGLVGIAVSLPYLLEVFAKQVGAPGDGSSPAAPLQFAVRHFDILDKLIGVGNSITWETNVVNLLALPLNYSLELGFFFIVAIIQCKRMWRNRHALRDEQISSFVLAATAIVVCTFVRSSVISNNDLGWRGFLIVQFILLMWGAEMLSDGLLSPRHGAWERGSLKRYIVIVTLFLGAAGSVYELVKIRFYPLQQDTTSVVLYPWLSPDRNLGERTFALREIYDELRHRTSVRAVYQHNPDTNPQDLFHGMYADRQLTAETPACGVVFGGNASLCPGMIREVNAIFDDPKVLGSTGIDGACERLSIDVLIVKDTDRVWHDRQSWVWQRTAIVANKYARALVCGAGLEARSRSGP
jgi:hypothetical protein